jgi:hypothetical protein
VAYKRPHLLTRIIEGVPNEVSKIYIFVDLSAESDYRNVEVIRIARDLSKNDQRISLRISEQNLGPGLAVPVALNWALQTSEAVLVLEDDCIPNFHAYPYFQENYKHLWRGLVICGTSPFDFQINQVKRSVNSLSKYALISGWMINRETWNLLNIEATLNFRYRDILRMSMRESKMLLPLSFFYASIIRVRSGYIHAWDSMFCFAMLIHDVQSLIPNVTVIDNLGFDSVASNTKSELETTCNVYNKSSETAPSILNDYSKKEKRITDVQIEKVVYRMKFRNFLSPAKSNLKVYLHKLVYICSKS